MYVECEVTLETITNLSLRRIYRKRMKRALQRANCSKFKFFKPVLVQDIAALEDYYRIRAEGEAPPTVSSGYLNLVSL